MKKKIKNIDYIFINLLIENEAEDRDCSASSIRKGSLSPVYV